MRPRRAAPGRVVLERLLFRAVGASARSSGAAHARILATQFVAGQSAKTAPKCAILHRLRRRRDAFAGAAGARLASKHQHAARVEPVAQDGQRLRPLAVECMRRPFLVAAERLDGAARGRRARPKGSSPAPCRYRSRAIRAASRKPPPSARFRDWSGADRCDCWRPRDRGARSRRFRPAPIDRPIRRCDAANVRQAHAARANAAAGRASRTP